MRRAVTIATVALLLIALGVPTVSAGDAGAYTVVTPDMTLSEIQEILDEGGTVHFAAGTYTQLGSGMNSQRFQLGVLGNDVTIIGAGADETMIVGGHSVFSAGIDGGNIYGIPQTEDFGDPLPRVQVSIEGIHFVDSYSSAIFVAASEGLSVSDCKFTRPRLSTGGGPPHPLGFGVMIGRGPDAGLVDFVRGQLGLPPLNLDEFEITGVVEITSNTFDGQGMSYEPLRDDGGELVLDEYGNPIRPDGVPEDAVFFEGLWYSGMSNAINQMRYTTADYLIADNVISGTLSTGIATTANDGTWTVVGNTVDASAYPSWAGTGIGLEEVNEAVVERNEITSTGPGIWAIAVDGGTFERNEITMRPSVEVTMAVWMTSVSNSTIARNEISGPLDFGLFFEQSDHNVFSRLDIDGAETGIALAASSYNSFDRVEIRGAEVGVWESEDSVGNSFDRIEVIPD